MDNLNFKFIKDGEEVFICGKMHDVVIDNTNKKAYVSKIEPSKVIINGTVYNMTSSINPNVYEYEFDIFYVEIVDGNSKRQIAEVR